MASPSPSRRQRTLRLGVQPVASRTSPRRRPERHRTRTRTDQRRGSGRTRRSVADRPAAHRIWPPDNRTGIRSAGVSESKTRFCIRSVMNQMFAPAFRFPPGLSQMLIRYGTNTEAWFQARWWPHHAGAGWSGSSWAARTARQNCNLLELQLVRTATCRLLIR